LPLRGLVSAADRRGERHARNVQPHHFLGGSIMAVARSDDGSTERQTGVSGPATRKKPLRRMAESGSIPSGGVRLDDLYRLPMPKLFALAEREGVTEHTGMTRAQLIIAVVRRQIERGEVVRGSGTLEVLPDGYGFLRSAAHNYLASPEDIYVSPSQIRRLGLLIDERPEEVTDMVRTVACPTAEVVASTFDEPASEHLHVSDVALEKAKRMVEDGRDVVLLLDSITRLARAHNTEAPSGGKLLSGGLDSNAMQKPKRFFGAARCIEEGGSLTILATALIDTGSRM